jgi:two-component system response regulator FixJ
MQVHVIDDDPAVRQMLGTAMESASLPARLYESAGEFLAEFDAQMAGCIVLDLRMPGMDGLELLRRLREMRVGLPIIVISGHADVPDAVQCMKLGAVDVLQKPFKIAKLIELVRSALQVSAESCQRVAEQEEIRRRFSTLTPREEELLKHVVSGSSSKQIARSLHISVMTVANHRAHLLAKTQASNSADLVRLAAVAGVVRIGT